MVSFTVRMRFRPEDRGVVEECLRELALASRGEPGCVSYLPHTLETDPNTVLIYEQYRDGEAVEAHRATAHFARWATEGLYPRMLDQTIETLSALV